MTRIESHLQPIAGPLGVEPALAAVLGALLVVLVVGTAARAGAWLLFSREADRKLLGRIVGWWVLVIMFIAVVLLPSPAVVVFALLVSLAAMYEYVRLLPEGTRDGRVTPWLYAMIPLHYAALWAWGEAALLFLLPGVLGVLAVRLVAADETALFLRRFAAAVLGWMMLVWSISFAALFDSPDGATGWFVLYVVLTESNDIAASWFGRWFGKAKIAPHVSPNKTWAGTLGGVATTVALAVVLAPFLTPWSWGWAVAAGLLVGVVGYFSDLTISAIKRDVGVKDAGSLLPEQGGVLDRVDSAILTAPLFYALVRMSEAAA